jgi:hypothetical protein
MDVAQFEACVTRTATLDRDRVPSLSSSNGFTYPLLIFSNTTQFNNVFNVNHFFQVNPCGHSPYATSSLTRGWVCFL